MTDEMIRVVLLFLLLCCASALVGAALGLVVHLIIDWFERRYFNVIMSLRPTDDTKLCQLESKIHTATSDTKTIRYKYQMVKYLIKRLRILGNIQQESVDSLHFNKIKEKKKEIEQLIDNIWGKIRL